MIMSVDSDGDFGRTDDQSSDGLDVENGGKILYIYQLYTPATHKRSSTLVQKFCSGAMLVTKVHQPGVLGVTIADIILDIEPLLKILL